MSEKNPPASDAQKQFAKDLGLKFPADITMQEMSKLLSDSIPATDRQKAYARELGLEFSPTVSRDRLSAAIQNRLVELHPPSTWLRDYAKALGLETDERTRRDLVIRIGERLTQKGPDTDLVIWFLYGVARHLTGQAWVDPSESGLKGERVAELAEILAEDKRFMGSLARYEGAHLYRFGEGKGRTSTVAYKAATAGLQSRLGVVPTTPAENRSSAPPRSEGMSRPKWRARSIGQAVLGFSLVF